MQRSYTEFVHELIKGKISEIVFQHLFSEHGFASVLPFGYEHTTHLLTQYQLQIPKETLDNIRYTPDFVLIKPDHTNAVFVDVKYRKTLQPHRVLELAERVEGKWPGCWLFLATQDRFFFAPCAVVIDRSGQIPKLRTQ
jgi:hypothetical protein